MRRFFWPDNSIITETNGKNGILWKAAPTEITLIDPVAFFGALILAPIIIGLIGVALVIPPVAVFFGAPLYLLFGTPVLWIALQKGVTTARAFAAIGFALMLTLLVPLALLEHIGEAPFLGLPLQVLAAFGLIFAPIWCAKFAVLYRKFRHTNYPLSA